ncbi:flagellar hook-associated protein FlgK [Caulobacter sp. NIBR1757]|uniref:flagellar hook-associated protein FlgK n=1 Tax=Caulobacter sp. NIBR1757 TaxID=3016000 RepID=UPI0022EFE5C6|nr:flagellar hook-associated protein FlgK [Caulobacter sp. NIBR1757]WGM40648.1 Flagellar hook-associated protein 1 [Caulobacter sp. NIBR1757]
MSLASIITSASTALRNTQYATSVAGQNVANADAAGYTTKTYTATATTAGVSLATGTLTRAASVYLLKSIVSGSAAAGSASVVDSYMQLYDAALGQVNDGGDLSSLTTAFQTALTDLASSQTSATRTAVVSAAGDLADSLNGLSAEIQSLRTQADQDIATAVGEVNRALQSLQGINDQIVQATAAGGDTATLFDARDQALTTLSGLMGVTYFVSSDGRANVYTTSGEQLVGSQAATLNYAAAGKLGAEATYPETLGGITLNGRDITAGIASGSLGGLISLRDDSLVEEQDALDAFAAALIAQVNAAAADGSAYPPPTSLTGATTLAGGDAITASGSVRISLLASDGTVSSSADLDLSSVSTVAGLVSLLNGVSGVSASLDDSGKIVIASSNGTSGIALGALDSDVGGQSLAAFLGLNAVFTGDDAGAIGVSSALTRNAGLLVTGVLTETGLASGNSDAVTALSAALDSDIGFAEAGGLSARRSSLADYATDFVSNAAGRVSTASSAATRTSSVLEYSTSALTNLTGVNLDEQTALMTQLQNQYQVTAQLITTARSMFDSLLSMMN